ncbi:Rieske 2Fe-2S domain-containing protein [Chromohalobacter israelensis]|uniref:Rieske (2Fe-2S) protein n=1 Tax=Chromohalobacter israelensis (strain ATCC BAA-138 / DSM 3043 / CIP 106854 / NCIMB 13768 / 1H11) TaxID=290398 RepID=Q1R0R0_CHRI1|nr:Rieske 2Fe-2S domain-containing protein [Chromohalobacter salexigens]ABE57698.1 Rieske (2Fe-2S) protein [Chromohalobacter salexigens DSM 3043]
MSHANQAIPLDEEAIFDAMPMEEEGQFANHATPLIRNCWYVCARRDEVGRTPISRRLLDTDVVMYRTRDGRPVAMHNRCPHRAFPLAKGHVEGDRLVCGYHGMQFEPDGLCAHLPAISHVPANACVQTYPIADRGPLTWIWMGDANLADEALIPELPWLASSEWGSVTGDFHIKADYVSMHENLIDQTHFPFLHPGTVGTPEYARASMNATTEGDQVLIHRRLDNAPPPGIYGKPADIMHKNVDRTSEARFVSPAVHMAHARIFDPQPEPGKPSVYGYYITHCFTPESNHSIHYWWFNSRDYGIDDTDIDAFMYEASMQAYYEDVEALEWIMDVVLTDNEAQQFELSFAPDKPGLMARRIMHRLAMSERG